MGFEKKYRHVASKFKGSFNETLVCYKGILVTATVGTPFSLLNPLGSALIVTKVVVDITTGVNSTPVDMNVGIGVSGTLAYDTLIDGAFLGTPVGAGVFDNQDDAGTNGKQTENWGATEYLTVTVTATPTDMVGNIYIWYRKA